MELQPSPSDLLRGFAQPCARFSTDSPDVAIAHLRSRFSPHRLRLTGAPGGFAVELAAGRLGGLEMSMLRYGTEVELSVETDADHILVTTQMAGWTRVRSQGTEGAGGIGLVVLDSCSSTVVKQFSADSCRLNLKIPRSHLNTAWTGLVGDPPHRPLVFQPLIPDTALGRRWWSHMGLLAGYLGMAAPPSSRLADALAESVLLSLLTEFPHSASEALCADKPAVPRLAAPRLAARMARADALMRERYREPLSLAEIAAECTVSIRTLTQLFHDRLGVSPMRHLQEIRLQAARALLQRGEPCLSVTQVALECGFSGLGRFAAVYRQRFGELPSKTGRG